MNQPQRLITFHAGLSDFAPAAMRLVRKGPELAIEDRVFVITSANIDQLVGELVEVDWPREGGPTSIETVRTSRQWIIERAVQTSLSAQRIALFPVRITTPEAGIHWQKDVAHGLVAQSLKSLVDSPKPIPEMADDAIRRDVADVVLVSIERLADHIRVHELADVRDGILARDASLADELERIGANGKKLAAKVRKQAKQRSAKPGDVLKLYEPWLPDGFLERDPVGGLPWIRALGRAAWLDVVQPRRKREFTKRPALAFYVHEEVTRVHSRAFQIETKNGQRALTFDDDDPIILAPSIEDESLIEIVERGAKLLGGIHAHQALRWEIVTGHTQAINGAADPRIINVDGGWSVLAHDVLGIKKKSAAEDLRAIIHAQQAVRIPLPTGGTAHGLLSFTDSPAVGRRRGHIEITLGSMLLPHFVYEIEGQGRSASEARRLVPVPREAPPMVGRSNDHGPLSTLSMLIMREMRANARALAKDGAVRIADERFAALAAKACVPLPTLKLALDRWTRDGDDGPAFLASPSRGAYTLGTAYAPELAFLVSSGKKELAASDAGRKSVAARERARLGRGRPRKKLPPQAE